MTPEPSEDDLALARQIREREEREAEEAERQARHRERQAKAEERARAKVEALKAARQPREPQPGALRGSGPVRYSSDDVDPIDLDFARALGY